MKSFGTLALALALASCVPDAPDMPVDQVEVTDDVIEPVGPEGGNGNGQSSISPSGYLERIAEIQCEQAFGCRATYPGTALEFEDTWGTSVVACTADLVIEWDPMLIETDIAKGRIEFDGTAAVACLGGVAFGSCAEHWDRGIQWGDPCYHVLRGMVAGGGMCETSYACASFSCDTIAHRCL